MDRLVFRMLAMLGAQYLLGMAENVIGMPSETAGVANAVSIALLAGHIAVGIGMLVGGFRLARRTRAVGGMPDRLAHLGLGAIALAFVAGGLTTMDTSRTELWSYAMAVAFIAAAAIYVALYVQLRTAGGAEVARR